MPEPLPPFYVNVIHLRVQHRPACLSAVDYARVQMVDTVAATTCNACLRWARILTPTLPSNLTEDDHA